jgi:hypothetical protein
VVATILVFPVVVDPTAQQSLLVGQDTATRVEVDVGKLCALQVRPPLVVVITDPAPEVVEPTAQQLLAVGHDTALRAPLAPGMTSAGLIPQPRREAGRGRNRVRPLLMRPDKTPEKGAGQPTSLLGRR